MQSFVPGSAHVKRRRVAELALSAQENRRAASRRLLPAQAAREIRSGEVRLPQQDKVEVNPPTASHVAAVYRLLPRAYRLPLVALESSGMRVGELESLVWGDADEQEGRWRVLQAKAKTNTARWVPRPGCRRSAPTTCATAERRSGTCKASHRSRRLLARPFSRGAPTDIRSRCHRPERARLRGCAR